MFKLFSRKRSEESKDLIYVSLVQAIQRGGCPICRLVSEAEEQSIRSLLYEHVNDPHMRKKIVESMGFCPYHFWMLVDLALEDPSLGGGLGPAIILEDLITRYLEVSTSPSAECFLCKQRREFEEIYIKSFAEKLGCTDILQRYRSAKNSILCRKHFNAIANLVPSDEVRREFIEIQRSKLIDLRDLIRRYIDKHDYRCREHITREEGEAWIRAVEFFAGYRYLLVPKRIRGF